MGSKKGWYFSFLLIVFIFGVLSFVSAATLNFHPQSGSDTTSSTNHSLNSGELNLLTSDDGDKYRSQGYWQNESFTDSETIDFYNFGINIPSGATVNQVTLKFDWSKSSDIDGARIKVWDASANSWQSYDLTLPGDGSDKTETINLTSYINQNSDFNNLKIRFQAHDGTSHNLYTYNDWVEVQVDYTPDYPTISNPSTTPQYPKNGSGVTICANVNDSLTINRVVLTCTSTEHVNIDYNMTATGNNYCSGFTWANSKDGETTSCTINATNSQGNSKIQNVPSFTYDGSAPITTSSGTDTNWHSSNVIVTLTPTDAISGVANTYYCVDQSGTCIPTTPGTSVTVSTEGTNYVRYYSVDNAGNIETTKQATNAVKIDKTAPTITNNYGFDGIWTNTNQNVTLIPSDSLSGINVVKYCTGTGCSPTTTLGSPYQLSYSPDQNIIVRYETWDLAGNPSVIGQFNVKLDKTGPTTSESGATSSWTKNDVTVTLSCSGAISGCNQTYYSIDNGSTFSIYTTPFTLSSTGQYQLVYYSNDNAGNVETAKTGTLVKIDKIAPTTTDNYANDNVWVNSDQTITLTPNDNGGSGLAWTKYCLTNGCNPSTGIAYTTSVTLSQGVNYFRYASADSAGNIEATNEKIVKIDETTPSTSDNVPATWQKVPFTITLTENTADGLSPMTTYYKIWNVEGTEPTSWTQGNSILVNSDGQYNVKYYTNDNAGNVETAKTAINIAKLDMTIPSVIIDGSLPLNWTNIPPSLSVECSDSVSGCDATSYLIKSVSAGTNCATADYSSGLSSPATISSHQYLCARASDNAGNFGYSNLTEILVDTTAPTLTITAPTEGQSTDKMDYFLVKATAADLGDSKLKNVILTLKNSTTTILSNQQMKVGIGDYEYLMSMWGLEAGNYVLEITATDNAGNNITQTRNFVIAENIAPTNIAGTNTNVPINGGTVSFVFNVTSRGSNLVRFGMDDIAGLSPTVFNARISNGTTSVPVGDASFNGAGILTLTDLDPVTPNTQGSFTLYLDIPANMTVGSYTISYYIDNDVVV